MGEHKHPLFMAAKLIIVALLIVLNDWFKVVTWPQFIAILLALGAIKALCWQKCCMKKKKK